MCSLLVQLRDQNSGRIVAEAIFVHFAAVTHPERWQDRCSGKICCILVSRCKGNINCIFLQLHNWNIGRMVADAIFVPLLVQLHDRNSGRTVAEAMFVAFCSMTGPEEWQDRCRGNVYHSKHNSCCILL